MTKPTINDNSNTNFAQNSSDLRYYNEAFSPGADNSATHAPCKDLLNINELTWYVMKGDPHSDLNELWTTMGHLYTGGVWFLKRDKIVGYSKTQAYDGTDWRAVGNGIRILAPLELLPVANANDYFFLPKLGGYYNGQLLDVGHTGYYWTSSAHPQSGVGAYNLHYDGAYLYAGRNWYRDWGSRVDPLFE